MTGAGSVLDRLAAGGRIASRVLIVLAHPDDETLGMGAQLCRFDDALLVHITDGAPRDGEDARNYGFGSIADYAAARRAELAAALRAGGADRLRTLSFGIPDKESWRDLVGLTLRVADLMRAEAPEGVLTHAYEGGHPDHDAAAFAVHAACRLADSLPAIIEMPFYHRSDGRCVGGEFLPCPALPDRETGEIALDADALARKRRMIESFATQLWLLRQFDLATERFRLAPAYDFRRPPHPGELHYETLGWAIAGSDWRGAAAAALDRLQSGRHGR